MTRYSQQESLRDFAVRVYADARVQRVCLDLQDRHHMDVNLVLYACWLSERQCALTSQAILAAEEACHEHRQRRVLPLRAERRKLKHHPATEAYEAAKARELDAEFQQLAFLEVLPQPEGDSAGDHLARNLDSLCRHYDVPGRTLKNLQLALRDP